MDRYLAFFDRTHSGNWISGEMYRSIVFEAENDKDAWTIALGKFSSAEAITVLRIVTGLQVVKVALPEDNDKYETRELDYKAEQEIGLDNFYAFPDLAEKLQPFSAEERKRRLAALRKAEVKERDNKKRVAAMPVPSVGQDIYVPSAMYLSHGRDDRCGGLATVSKVEVWQNGNHFLSVKEFPGVSSNWEAELALKQDELKKQFGASRAHLDPDYSPEFNEP